MARGPSHSLRLASYFVAPAAIEARLWKLSLTRQFGQWHDARLRDGATEGDESGQRTWSVERGRGGGQRIGAGTEQVPGELSHLPSVEFDRNRPALGRPALYAANRRCAAITEMGRLDGERDRMMRQSV